MAQQTRELRVWQALDTKQQAQVILFWVLAIAVATGFVSAFEGGQLQWRNLGQNLATELVGGAITFLVFQYVLDRREKDELKQRLIREMSSRNNSIALNAVEELHAHGWLFDGSLLGVLLQRANLRGVDLSGAQLEGAILAGANLQHTNLRGTYLKDASLSGAYLQKADLKYADLEGVYLVGAQMEGADLERVHLADATLRTADLEGVKSWAVDLQDADLERVNLQDAYLTEASLQGAKLVGANLQGTDFKYAQLNESTILPDESRYNPRQGLEQLARFTDPNHPHFWRSDHPNSPAYRSDEEDSGSEE